MAEPLTGPDMCESEEREFRKTMSQFATGVTVVTTRSGGESHGMTLNSLTSVSLRPRLLLVCLATSSRTAHAALQRGAFVVNLLSAGQQELSRRFAAPGGDHFAGLVCRLNRYGLPELPGTIGALSCAVHDVHSGGDHHIVVGRVLACRVGAGDALVLHRGRYGRCVAA